MGTDAGNPKDLSPVRVIDGSAEAPLPDDAGFLAAHTTAPELAEIERELIGREPLFHREEHGLTRAGIERMTAPEFWEVSASGRRYSRAYVLDVLEARYAEPHAETWHVGGYRTQQLAPDLYLFTYTLKQGERVTRRTTIWTRASGDWQIVYHQGTVVAG